MSTVKKPTASLAKKETETKVTTVKKEAESATAKKVTAAKTAKKPAATKSTAKKTTAKTTAAKAVKETKKAVKIAIQYADKEYSSEDLERIANDVWVYDFGKKASELKDVQLFVKPEESKVYYIFNNETTGFFII